MRYSLSICILLLSFALSAQYATPNTGVRWNLQDLIDNSGGIIETPGGSLAFFTEDITISENDTLIILHGVDDFLSPRLNEGVRFIVQGHADIRSSLSGFSIESNIDQMCDGIVFEAGSSGWFQNTNFQNMGGLELNSGEVTIQNCTFFGVSDVLNLGTAIQCSSGAPVFNGCFIDNSIGSAISSPANIPCSPQITNCNFSLNNTDNSNRPQINLGPSLDSIPTRIQGCYIGFSQSLTGGIAISSLFNDPTTVILENNNISYNRYGIALLGGNINATIRNNVIELNNVQQLPFEGGSGINLNGPSTSMALIEGNEIRDNLWGITVQDDFQVDMGTLDSPDASQGGNIFSDNGNDGQTYALFNNTPSPISAQGNCWIEGQISEWAEIEDVISHEVDDAALGEVNFSSPICATSLFEELDGTSLLLYPNPSADFIRIEGLEDSIRLTYAIFNMTGQEVLKGALTPTASIDISRLEAGQYIISLLTEERILQTSFSKD